MGQVRTSLVEDFQRYFTLQLATTPELLRSVHRIRYRVYCEEFGFESAAEFSDEQEVDEFDAHSRHCIVMHKSTGLPAGCARLVLAGDNRQMPIEKYCSGALDNSALQRFADNRNSVCEFSRLAVDGAFRRRSGEQATRFGEMDAIDVSNREQRSFSLIAVATILSALAMSELLERPNCFAMMESFLPRLLRRSGLVVHRAGDEMEYHGQRTPYYWETRETLGGMVEGLHEFYAHILQKFRDTGELVPAALQFGAVHLESTRPGCSRHSAPAVLNNPLMLPAWA